MTVLKQHSNVRPDIEEALGLGKSKTPPLFSLGRWLIVAGLAFAALVGFYFLWGAGGSSDGVNYVTEPATRTDLKVVVTATGTVQPINEVDVSSELSGIIRKVYVDYNSKVTKGQLLAELDTDKLQATVDSSRAKLAAAEAKVKDAEATLAEKKLDYERKRQLAARKIATEYDLQATKAAYERALAAVDSAKADVAASAADLKLNETNLSKAKIVSPINGIVLARDADVGQTVASSLQAPVLFTLAEDLSKMEVEVAVDEADVGQVKEGQNAVFSVDAYAGRSFTAQIRELHFGSETTTQGVVTYKAVLMTDNADLLLRPGMTATAEISVLEVKDALSIPNTALRYQPPAQEPADTRSFLQKILPGPPRLRKSSKAEATGPNRQIWILDGGKAREVDVKIGSSDGQRTEIVEGDLKPGQAVIIDTAASGG